MHGHQEWEGVFGVARLERHMTETPKTDLRQQTAGFETAHCFNAAVDECFAERALLHANA